MSLSRQVFALLAVGIEGQKYFLEPKEVSVHHHSSFILSDEMNGINVRTESLKCLGVERFRCF